MPESRARGLSAEHLASLFPFHFIYDEGARLVACGPSLSKLVPSIRPGDRIEDHFEVRRPGGPFEFETTLGQADHLFILSLRTTGLLLRGQILRTGPSEAIFLGSPWFTEAGDLTRSGLTMRDFALHDSATDLLLLLQAQSSSLGDSKHLAQKLRARSEELRGQNEALRDAESLMRSIFETAAEGIVSADASGEILTFNPAAEKIFGYRAEEVVGKNLELLMPEPFRSAHRGYMARYLETEEPHIIGLGREVSGLRKDGTVFPCELSVGEAKVGSGGRIFTGFLRDVSDRKQAQAEILKAKEEAERANRMKGEFLAGMSHELRTPLNAVLGLSEALREGIYGALTPDHTEPLRTIESSGRHLLSLINDILDLSKIEAGELALSLGPVNLEEVCQASLGFVKGAAAKKGLSVSTSFQPAGTVLEADARRLKQMLVNLLSNAVKFTPPGGKVGIEASLAPGGDEVVISVWDTGCGVPEEHREAIFLPFVQVETGLARGSSGTGLGLPLVKRMAEMHGGAVTLDSTPGQGSKFTLHLPRASAPPGPGASPVRDRSAAPAGEGDGGDAPPGPPARILLVEDHPANAEMVRRFLVASGLEVALATSGAEALEHLKGAACDLVLMDIQMPGMDGIEATGRIRGDLGMREIPIVAMTALAMPGDRERCLAAGADAYISKPVGLKDLVRLIRNLLGGSGDGARPAKESP